MNDVWNGEDIILKKDKGIEYLQFKRLNDFNVKHCYTLKSDNINFSENSKERDESFIKIANSLDINPSFLVRPIQTHTANVRCIDKILNPQELKEIDGLITNKSDIALVARNADCILMLFYDPINKVIANVHSGWRGTFQKICEKTVQKMITYYQCKPENINCFICPSIRKCHFEVDEDVKMLCENIFYFLDTNTFIEKGDIIDKKQKYYIDTVLINKLLLKNLCIREENIIDCNICSVCEKDKVHSYRIEKENKKIAASIIML